MTIQNLDSRPGGGNKPRRDLLTPANTRGRSLVEFLKTTGTNVFSAVEVMNEIDLL